MKQFLLIWGLSLISLSGFAKELQTVIFTTTPQMHCERCENKIKNGLKYEKGIKDILTSVPNQTVTIKYDAKKTSVEKLTEAFKNIGYSVREVKDGETIKTETSSCGNMGK